MSLLFNEDFEPYRQLEIKEGILFLKKLENGKEGPDYYRGAMEMLRAIINLPGKMAGAQPGDNETGGDADSRIKQAEVMKIKALDYFEARMVRSYLDE
jgi:hypothetical protein